MSLITDLMEEIRADYDYFLTPSLNVKINNWGLTAKERKAVKSLFGISGGGKVTLLSGGPDYAETWGP